MNKSFEAYYSPQWAWLWLVLAIIFAICIGLFVLLLPYPLSLIMTLSFSVCLLFFLWMYRKTKQQMGIAAEIVDDVLILYKKEIVSIPLNEIQRIDIHDGYGSFDLIVKTAGKRIQFHCFIEDQMEKKRQLIQYLKSKSINVQTYDLVD